MLNYLNIHYGVCFGFIFSLLFLPSESNAARIEIRLIGLDQYISISFVLMIFYLFADWAYAVRQGVVYDAPVNWIWLAVSSIAIWSVGFICASVLSGEDRTPLYLIIYAFFISVYNCLIVANATTSVNFGANYRYMAWAKMVISLASVLLIGLAIWAIYLYIMSEVFSKTLFEPGQITFILACGMVANKIVRFLVQPTKSGEENKEEGVNYA